MLLRFDISYRFQELFIFDFIYLTVSFLKFCINIYKQKSMFVEREFNL